VLLLSIGVFVNVLSAFALLQLGFDKPLLAVIAAHPTALGALAVMIVIVNYTHLARGSKLERIVSAFEKEAPSRAKCGAIAVATYALLSPVVFFALLIAVAMGS
jgi:hypothetical protein